MGAVIPFAAKKRARNVLLGVEMHTEDPAYEPPPEVEECFECAGTGQVTCSACDGEGVITREDDAE